MLPENAELQDIQATAHYMRRALLETAFGMGGSKELDNVWGVINTPDETFPVTAFAYLAEKYKKAPQVAQRRMQRIADARRVERLLTNNPRPPQELWQTYRPSRREVLSWHMHEVQRRIVNTFSKN